MKIESKLEDLGLTLPEPMQLPPGMRLPFAWVRVRGDRAYVSGHAPLNPDGSLSGPFGKVGAEISPEEGYEAAWGAALSVLGNLKRELGDLDRVSAWLMVHGRQRGAGFRRDHRRNQQFLRPDPEPLRFRSRHARPNGSERGNPAAESRGLRRRRG